jgi:hypothetical protein
MAVGILIAGATGLCMSMFWGGPNPWHGVMQAFSYLGLPFLLGVGMIIARVIIISSGRRRSDY